MGGTVRAAVRTGIAGYAVVLTALLTGCGSTEAPPGPGRPATSGNPSGAPSTAPGVDGEADPDRVFTEADLKAALLPAEAFGRRARVTGTDLGLFGRYGGGDWSQCEPADDLREELRGFAGAGAQQTVRLAPAAEHGPIVTVQLVSMAAERTERYLEVRRRLHETCADVTVDTEAAPVLEHHEARDIAGLGDEALLEISRLTGGDEYDGTPSYAVDVRVGGVLAIVRVGGDKVDKDTGLSLATRTAQRIRTELYGADQGVSGEDQAASRRPAPSAPPDARSAASGESGGVETALAAAHAASSWLIEGEDEGDCVRDSGGSWSSLRRPGLSASAAGSWRGMDASWGSWCRRG
ncbi:hypothetical protein [Streptomyces sp. 8N706]|uniref:hypothetical protein n=1 Tax=Streptomyces sp. 8N706 TaxID=3457416 RepID=UPI003FCFA660